MAAADSSKLYSTYKTFLMQGTGSGTLSYSKLADIKDYPNIGGAADQIDMTSLSNKIKVGVAGIQNSDAMAFTMNYNPTVYQTLDALTDGEVYHFAIYFGGTESGGVVTPDGSDGKWTFDGTASLYTSGKGVNEGREMVFTIYPSTEPVFTAPS